MIRISCSAYSFQRQFSAGELSQFDLLAASARLKFDAVEFVADYFPTTDRRYLNELKLRAYHHGLAIANVIVNTDFTVPDSAERRIQVSLTCEWIERAVAMGASSLLISTGVMRPDYGYANIEAWITSALKECTDYAYDRGVMLLLQNSLIPNARTPDPIDFISSVNSPGLRLSTDLRGLNAGRTDLELDLVGWLCRSSALRCEWSASEARNKTMISECRQNRRLLREIDFGGFVAVELAGNPLYAHAITEYVCDLRSAFNATPKLGLLDNIRMRIKERVPKLWANPASDLKSEIGWTDLMSAVVRNDGFEIERLVADGADINAAMAGGHTALMVAAACGRDECVRLLVERGGQINDSQEFIGYTPLMLAAGRCSVETISLLIDRGADVNALTWHTVTALNHARKRGRSEVADLLIRSGAVERNGHELEGIELFHSDVQSLDHHSALNHWRVFNDRVIWPLWWTDPSRYEIYFWDKLMRRVDEARTHGTLNGQILMTFAETVKYWRNELPLEVYKNRASSEFLWSVPYHIRDSLDGAELRVEHPEYYDDYLCKVFEMIDAGVPLRSSMSISERNMMDDGDW